MRPTLLLILAYICCAALTVGCSESCKPKRAESVAAPIEAPADLEAIAEEPEPAGPVRVDPSPSEPSEPAEPALDVAAGRVLDFPNTRLFGGISAIAEDDEHVFVGGSLSSAEAKPDSLFEIRNTANTVAALPGLHKLLSRSIESGRVHEAVSDGDGGWFIGGNLVIKGESKGRHLAHVRANGTLNPAWAPDVSPGLWFRVTAMAVTRDKIIVSANFERIEGEVAIKKLVAFSRGDGKLIEDWGKDSSPTFHQIDRIIADDDVLFVSGPTQRPDFVAALSLADGSRIENWGSDGLIEKSRKNYVLGATEDALFLSFQGDEPANSASKSDNLIAYSRKDGTLQESWRIGGEGAKLQGVVVREDKVYAAYQAGAGEELKTVIAAYSREAGALTLDWSIPFGPHREFDDIDWHDVEPRVFSLYEAEGALYVIGSFSLLAGQGRTNFAIVSLKDGAILDDPVGRVNAQDDYSYSSMGIEGGHEPVVQSSLMALSKKDGVPRRDWDPGICQHSPGHSHYPGITHLAADADRLYARGGVFTFVAGKRLQCLVYDEDEYYDLEDGEQIKDLPEIDQEEYGGAEGLVALSKADASVLWTAPVDVGSLLLDGGRIYVTSLDGRALLALNPEDGSLIEGWAFDVDKIPAKSTISRFAIEGDDIFMTVNLPRDGLRRSQTPWVVQITRQNGSFARAWEIHSWGRGDLHSIAIDSQRFYVAGVRNPSNSHESLSNYVAAYSREDGSLLWQWSPAELDERPLNIRWQNPFGFINDIALDKGRLYVGGRGIFVALSPEDGTLVTQWDMKDPMTGHRRGEVSTIQVGRERIYVGGAFQRFAGEQRFNLAAIAREP